MALESAADVQYNRGMVVTVDEIYLPLTLCAPGITDDRFDELCELYEDFRVEYTAEGDVLVMPPTDEETGMRNSSINYQLMRWALTNERGAVTDSSTGFRLPNGARRSPDAAWISRQRLGRRPNCPEFVIELLSPSDRRTVARAKMQEWIDNGAELGWMLDPKSKSVTIYRTGREPEIRTGLNELAGEGVVDGFVLDLGPVWK